MNFFAKSDIGKAREMNQDAYYASQPSDTVGLYIVADGMGGYNGGEVASTIAVTAAKNYIETNFAETEHTKEKLQELVKNAIKSLILASIGIIIYVAITPHKIIGIIIIPPDFKVCNIFFSLCRATGCPCSIGKR